MALQLRRCMVWVVIILVGPTALAQTNSETTLLATQRDFVARFSGARSLADGSVLPARSTQAERERAADMLVLEFERRGLTANRHRYWYPNIHFSLDLIIGPFRGQNVVVEIPSTNESDSYVVIGAHYDSVPDGPGADDNATGVALALTVAEVLSSLPVRNKNFLIVFFDQEEEDGAGSKAYVRKLLRDGVAIHSMHNIDMVGWDSDGDRGVEIDMPTPELEALFRDAADALGIPVTSVRYNSTDHQSFRDVGIAATCLSEQYASGDTTPHHHESTDTVSTVNFEFLASTTKLMAEAMTALAKQP